MQRGASATTSPVLLFFLLPFPSSITLPGPARRRGRSRVKKTKLGVEEKPAPFRCLVFVTNATRRRLQTTTAAAAAATAKTTAFASRTLCRSRLRSPGRHRLPRLASQTRKRRRRRRAGPDRGPDRQARAGVGLGQAHRARTGVGLGQAHRARTGAGLGLALPPAASRRARRLRPSDAGPCPSRKLSPKMPSAS